jgi:phage recombination protein Bet
MQTQSLERINNIREGILSGEQIKTLAEASIIPYDTPAPILQVFAATCAAHGLSPYKREIYLVKYGSQYNTIVGIDGLRAKAARTGEFAGRDDAQFNRTSDGKYLTAFEVLQKGGTKPETCTVTVYRLIGGVRFAFTKTVLWEEYCPINVGGKWKTMGFNMIEKCAEAAALRMGFADETAGLHIPEERAAYEDNSISAAQANPALAVDVKELQGKIDGCKTADALNILYRSNSLYANFADLFTARKNELV